MNKDEILRYITLCVSYKHNNDISPHITKSAEEKEDLLFESAIEFLEKLDKENKELKAQIEKMKCCENCYYHKFWGNDLGCKLSYDIETECLKTKNKWRLWEE